MEKGFTQDLNGFILYVCASGNIECKYRKTIYVYKEAAIPVDYCSRKEFECTDQERKILINVSNRVETDEELKARGIDPTDVSSVAEAAGNESFTVDFNKGLAYPRPK